MMLFKKHDGSNGLAFQYENSSGVYRLKFTINVNNLYENIVLDTDTWYHVVAVYNGSDQIIYLNGTALSVGTSYSSDITGNTVNAYMGSTGTSSWLNGYIDEFIIYDDALSLTEIQDRYNFFLGEIQKPFLTKDNNGVGYLFYEDEISGTNTFTVSYENPCSCSEWVNTTTCVEDRIKQTRTCNPELCEVGTEERWVDSQYCELTYNRSVGIWTQNYEPYIIVSECESSWVDIEVGIAECIPDPIQIPTNCINPVVNMTSIGVLDNEEGCDKGNWTVTSCNPTYDCNEEVNSCLNTLDFLRKDKTDYFVGEFATGKAIIEVDNICRCQRFLLGDKIDRFQVMGVLALKCDVACEEEWFCLNDEYKALKRIDCSIANQTFCDLGCVNGECATTVGESPSSPLNPVTWFERIFNPDTKTKFAYSLGGSILIGIFLLSTGGKFDKTNSSGGLLFAFGFGIGFALFVALGWIPVVMIFVIIFFVGAYALLKMLQ